MFQCLHRIELCRSAHPHPFSLVQSARQTHRYLERFGKPGQPVDSIESFMCHMLKVFLQQLQKSKVFKPYNCSNVGILWTFKFEYLKLLNFKRIGFRAFKACFMNVISQIISDHLTCAMHARPKPMWLICIYAYRYRLHAGVRLMAMLILKQVLQDT